jgi:hypothetical protein
MTGAELITEVRELLDEPSPNAKYYNDTRLLAWINMAYRRMARITCLITDRTNILVTGTTYRNDVDSTASSPIHYMPTDFLALDPGGGVYWLDSAACLIKLREMDKKQASLEGWFNAVNISGVPKYYVINYVDADDVGQSKSGKRIEVYPYPSAVGNKLQAYYIKEPTALTTATSPIIDNDRQWSLVYDAAAMGKAKRRLFDESNFWRGRAEEIYEDIKAEVADRGRDEFDRPTQVGLPYSE